MPTTSANLGVRPTLKSERRLWREGHHLVAGLDEVGRGAWAGPLTACVAVLRPGVRSSSVPKRLRDSKLLPEECREEIFDQVASFCAAWSVGHASHAECDRFGMTAALRLAAYRALDGLPEVPDALLVDGPYDLLRQRPLPARVTGQEAGPDQGVQGRLDLGPATAPGGTREPAELAEPTLPLPEVAVPSIVVPMVDADAHCVAVAAASVLAKVVRDRIMRADAECYPPYQFERNKGYPSPAHKCALRGYGLSAIHRRSWAFADELPWRSPGRITGPPPPDPDRAGGDPSWCGRLWAEQG